MPRVFFQVVSFYTLSVHFINKEKEVKTVGKRVGEVAQEIVGSDWQFESPLYQHHLPELVMIPQYAVTSSAAGTKITLSPSIL